MSGPQDTDLAKPRIENVHEHTRDKADDSAAVITELLHIARLPGESASGRNADRGCPGGWRYCNIGSTGLVFQ